MGRFIPRHISQDQAAQGYNNEGRGELLGYIAIPDKHEIDCPYRRNPSTYGGPDGGILEQGSACACRIGLWRDTPTSVKVVNEMRKTAKRKSVTKPRRAKSTKARRALASGK